jgi:DNA-binding transcriptional MerR regulator
MPSGHRRYDEETVRFLRAIKEAQAVGPDELQQIG